jgi:hypothetical protein
MLLDWIVPEVLEIIISFLPTHHEVLRLSLTCRDLNDLCSAPLVWKGLSLKMFRSDDVYAVAAGEGIMDPKNSSFDDRWRTVYAGLSHSFPLYAFMIYISLSLSFYVLPFSFSLRSMPLGGIISLTVVLCYNATNTLSRHTRLANSNRQDSNPNPNPNHNPKAHPTCKQQPARRIHRMGHHRKHSMGATFQFLA